MTARSEARRGPGPGWVLGVLLAALVHLLMCAHGPVDGGSGPSVDAVSVASASCPAPAEHHADHPADHHDGAGHRAECAGFDQPVTVGQEPAGAEEPASAGTAGAPAAVPSPVPPAPLGGVDDGGRARAVLGVWRT